MVSYGLSGLQALANLLSQDLTDVGGKTQQLDSHRGGLEFWTSHWLCRGEIQAGSRKNSFWSVVLGLYPWELRQLSYL